MSEKLRLDVAVYERGLAETREKAKAMIMAGVVYVNGIKAVKCGDKINPEDEIAVKGKTNPYVSRGGLKLEKAINVFGINLNNKICLDIGASTGGFTDCMLQNGASNVYSVDVGYGQLAWKLRTDPKVVNLERTNFRYCTKENIPDDIDFASVDVSFISLKIILPVMYRFLKQDGLAVCLIKPQFEAGKENIGKKGVVRDKSVHLDVVTDICTFAQENGFVLLGLDYSPVKGPEGNIEYLMYLSKSEVITNSGEFDISGLVNASHLALD